MEDVRQPRREVLRSRGRRLAGQVIDLHERYARLFWTVHSAWALLTGIVVLVLAHNRYGFLPWVVLFLALTWASTLFFSRFSGLSDSRMFRFARGFVSYLTRVMYQETLFFLLPFYFYSTTLPSWNMLYVLLLAGLAALSCFDIVFDRLLRERRAFALGFFAVVTFSALQFFIPLLLHVRVHLGAYLAAAISLLAAVPLAYGWRELRQPRLLLRLGAVVLLSLVAVRVARPVVPPVPLRLAKVRFAAEFDPRTLKMATEYTGRVPESALSGGRLYAVATIFSPARLPTSVTLRFVGADSSRTSRTLDVIAHERGFRVWGLLRAGPRGFAPGTYAVEVWTAEGQLIGRETIEVVAGRR